MQAKLLAYSVPALKQLVLVGGGHSHLAVLSDFARRPVPGLRIVLISEDTMTAYSGMLPGLIAGQYQFDQAHIDLRRLCEASGVTFLKDRVDALDVGRRMLRSRDHGEIHWHWLSINTGSTPDTSSIRDPYQRAIGVKPINAFLNELSRIERLLAEAPDRELTIGVVGAGAAGVEVALSLHSRFRHRFPSTKLTIHLFGSQPAVAPGHNRKVQAYLESLLARLEIQLHLGSRIVEIGDSGVTDEHGDFVFLDEVFLVTGSMPQSWLAQSGLALDSRGFVRIAETLQSVSHSDVFAAGDVASMDGYTLEKAGVFAVRQGRPLAVNLRRKVNGRVLRPYRPQSKWLAILNLGDGIAVASRGKFFAAGGWVWRWKDYIDLKFMRMYQTFSPMSREAPKVPASLRSEENEVLLQNLSMRCNGCGSKVGSSVLSRSLARLSQPNCEELQHAEDAAVLDLPPGTRLVQSLDYFTAPIDDPLLVGQLAAVHSLSDIHAMGAVPHSAQAIVALPLASGSIMGEVLEQVLAGAVQIFSKEGVCLVGGHTTESQLLSVGFVVNGWLEGRSPWTKQGIRAADAIILTKPLGTGVLLAGHQQALARGQWLENAFRGMTRSNADAARVMKAFDVHACTDITGFGLMGHLAEMLNGTSVSLELSLDRLPFYSGALELSGEGVRSTLFADNASHRHIISNLEQVASRPEFPLLFDPQTAGGLLFTLPESQAQGCIEALATAGIAAAHVGKALHGKGEVYWR